MDNCVRADLSAFHNIFLIYHWPLPPAPPRSWRLVPTSTRSPATPCVDSLLLRGIAMLSWSSILSFCLASTVIGRTKISSDPTVDGFCLFWRCLMGSWIRWNIGRTKQHSVWSNWYITFFSERYSLGNCLFEAALEESLRQCNCVPEFRVAKRHR